MRHVNVELLPEGGARVWRDFPNIPAALKAVELLLTINPEAFDARKWRAVPVESLGREA